MKSSYTKNMYTSQRYDDKLSSDPEAPEIAEVLWLGDSRDVLRSFGARFRAI